MAVSLKASLGVNFAGRFWAGIVGFIATPLYLKWLGVEAYGLVGFYLLLQAVTGFFGAGLTSAANREIAAESPRAGGNLAAKLVGFGRTAWALGLILGLGVGLSSEWLATHWLTVDRISPDAARRSILLMAPLLALQVPLDFYVGALQGMHRPALANLTMAGTATARALAGVLGLIFWTPTIETFFWSQLLASLGLVLACELWVRPVGHWWRGPMPWANLRQSFRFSAGMTAVAFTGMVLSQTDRVVLSRALRLEDFALYALATTLANLLYNLIAPVQATYYPEFSRQVAASQSSRLAAIYHQACQRMAVVVMPAGAVMLFFARDLLALWTGRPDYAAKAAPAVMLLVGSRMISGLNSLPYALQYAYGYTSLVLKTNLVSIGVFIPLLYVLAQKFGAVGAAGGYLLLSLPFLVVIVWRTHRRLLPGEAGRWLWQDTAPPLGLALLTAGIMKWLQPADLNRPGQLLWLLLASATTLGLVVAVNPASRAQLRTAWQRRHLA